MPRGHREHGGEDDGRSRAEDRSLWMRSAKALEKYKVLVWAVGILAISAGYGFETPKKSSDQLRAEIARQAQRIDSLERLPAAVDALVRIQCVSAKPDALRLAGIDCERWLGSSTSGR